MRPKRRPEVKELFHAAPQTRRVTLELTGIVGPCRSSYSCRPLKINLDASARDHYLQALASSRHDVDSVLAWVTARTRLKPVLQTDAILKRILLVVAVVALYVLHQDFWFWRTARPLIFGFIPIGLFYHACYSVAAALLMWLLVKYAWPSQLEHEVEEQTLTFV